MQDNLNQLEKEFFKVNKVVGVSALICIISSILVFFNVAFYLITIISLIICFKNYKKLNNLKASKENIKKNNNSEKLESKDIAVKEHLDKGINEEDNILNKMFLKNTDNSEELESKDIVVKEYLNEEVNEEDDILNERFLKSTELYLKVFNDLPKYDITKSLDDAFIKKITRIKDVEYEKFVKPSGTTSRPMDFVVFDIETTGLSAQSNEIIEIGAIRFNTNKPVEIFHTYIKPKKKISSRITSINGITNEMVENYPTIEEVLPKFIDFIGDNVLIAHNSNFDMAFILNQLYSQGYKKIKNKVIDTLKLSRQKIREYDILTDRDKKLDSYKLEKLKYAFGLWEVGSHNAIDDCKVCAFVYMKIKNEYGDFCYVD